LGSHEDWMCVDMESSWFSYSLNTFILYQFYPYFYSHCIPRVCKRTSAPPSLECCRSSVRLCVYSLRFSTRFLMLTFGEHFRNPERHKICDATISQNVLSTSFQQDMSKTTSLLTKITHTCMQYFTWNEKNLHKNTWITHEKNWRTCRTILREIFNVKTIRPNQMDNRFSYC
jgi:hypothetical protein